MEKYAGTALYKMDIIMEKINSKIWINCLGIRERFEGNEDIHISLEKISLDFFSGGREKWLLWTECDPPVSREIEVPWSFDPNCICLKVLNQEKQRNSRGFLRRYQEVLVSETAWTETSISRLILEISDFLEFQALKIWFYK
jgi:hypothetical protein